MSDINQIELRIKRASTHYANAITEYNVRRRELARALGAGYEAGLSVSWLANLAGLPRRDADRLIRSTGIEIRPRGRPQMRGGPHVVPKGGTE